MGISCTARIFKQYISCKVRALYRGWVFFVFLVFVCIVFFLFKLYPLLWGFCIVAHLKTKSVIYNFNSHWFIPSVFPSFYLFIYLFYFLSHARLPTSSGRVYKESTRTKGWKMVSILYYLSIMLFFNSNLFLTCFSSIFPQPPQFSTN